MLPLAPEPEVCFAMFSYHSFAKKIEVLENIGFCCALGINQNGSHTTSVKWLLHKSVCNCVHLQCAIGQV